MKFVIKQKKGTFKSGTRANYPINFYLLRIQSKSARPGKIGSSRAFHAMVYFKKENPKIGSVRDQEKLGIKFI